MKARAGAKSAELKAGKVRLGAVAEETVKPLRPGQCRNYMRRELAREFRSIVDGFVKGAKSGSCQHVKLATELLAPPAKAKRRPNGNATLRRLVQKMEQIKD